MKSVPRILPLVGIAVCGVLAVNALAGARDLPSLLSGAQAFAEEAAKPISGKAAPNGSRGKAAKPAADGVKSAEAESAMTGTPADAAAAPLAPSIAPRAVCAPTAAELAKQAGLSPAELQVLQNLGARRGQLDARESDQSTQLALIAAAEAKLDAKIKALTGLKGEVQGLLTQSNAKQAGEIDRLVKVFEGMKAKDAAPRLSALDDNVRIPIAAKMKERALSAIMAQMAPTDAKKLTESLARRYSDAQAAAAKAEQVGSQAAPSKPSVDPTAAPVKKAAAASRKAPSRKTAPAAQQAAAKPAPTESAPTAAPGAAAAVPPKSG